MTKPAARVSEFVRISSRVYGERGRGPSDDRTGREETRRRRRRVSRWVVLPARRAGTSVYGLTTTCMKLPSDDTLTTLITVPVLGTMTLFHSAW